MAIIKPFKGVRPPKELVEQVASRPYDVLNSEEARKEAEGNEKSLYHTIKADERQRTLQKKRTISARKRALEAILTSSACGSNVQTIQRLRP